MEIPTSDGQIWSEVAVLSAFELAENLIPRSIVYLSVHEMF